jgi:3-oxoacyl-[acyl-carrier protein] reductase
MNLGLKGKFALVTGGSRGIGRATALALADEGCNVAICGRSPDTLAATVAEVEEKGVRGLGVRADVTVPADTERLVAEVVAAFGRLDVLVNNVGGSKGSWAFLEASEDDWVATVDANLWPTIRLCRLGAAQMKAQGSGVIVNIASIWGRESGGGVSYNVTKAGVISLTKNIARQLAPFGIRANSVAPGSVLHPGGGWERRVQADPEGMADFVKRNLPYGRFGKPEEVGSVIAFLCSERASLVTGACVNVDGGQSVSNV